MRTKPKLSGWMPDLLICKVSIPVIEQRQRVEKPKGCRFIKSTGHVPTDDFWALWRGPRGRAYYVQKEREITGGQINPWKKNEFVKLTPAEAVAWLVDLWGNPQMRCDVLRQLKP